jgi:hypothetical protein
LTRESIRQLADDLEGGLYRPRWLVPTKEQVASDFCVLRAENERLRTQAANADCLAEGTKDANRMLRREIEGLKKEIKRLEAELCIYAECATKLSRYSEGIHECLPCPHALHAAATSGE